MSFTITNLGGSNLVVNGNTILPNAILTVQSTDAVATAKDPNLYDALFSGTAQIVINVQPYTSYDAIKLMNNITAGYTVF